MSDLYNPELVHVAGTLVIGLGGTGVETVRLIKARVRQTMEKPSGIIEFAVADTEPRHNLPGLEHISQSEYAYLGDYNARRVLEELEAHPHIKEWWFEDNEIVTGTVHKGARQRRPIGRLSLYVNWGEFARIFSAKAHQIREIVEREKTQRAGFNVRRTGVVKIYIIASLCGGTGSAIFLDVAFHVRQILGDEADIMGVFLLPSCFLPEIQSFVQQRRIRANAYAALREINHFMQGQPFHASFPDKPFTKNREYKNHYRPFDSLYLVDRSNGKEYISNLENIRHMVAQQIFLDIVTPMGERYAARRANLQDLAGESSRRADETQLQPLAISGFATASIVFPVDELKQRASNLFGAVYIKRHQLDHFHRADDKLDREIETRVARLYDLLRFEKPQTAVSNDNKPPNLFNSIRPPGSDGRASNIDLTNTQSVIREVYEKLYTGILADYETHRLNGVLYTTGHLRELISQRTQKLNTKINQSKQTREEIEKQLNNDKPPQATIWQRIGELLAFWRGSNRRQRQWIQQKRQWEQEKRDLDVIIKRDELARSTLESILESLDTVRQTLNGQISTISDMCERMARSGVNINGFQNKLADRQQDAGLFELATWIGGEGFSGSELYWRNVPQEWADEVYLDPVNEQTFSKLMGEQAFCLELNEHNDRYWLHLHPLQADRIHHIERCIQELFTASIKKENLSIMWCLGWLYENISHGSNESRHSPLDPLQMLKLRCREPFLEIDRARLGTEGAHDTEPVRLIGIPLPRLNNMTVTAILEDFPSSMWEDVVTGLHHRIDISYSRHGYPVRVLKDIYLYKQAYEHFIDSQDEKLHPHKDWPNGMDDLL